jgi:RNA polymerase sigma-70 factor (ECF subfamily)
VSEKRPATGSRHDAAPGTLGDILYSGDTRAPVSEAEWVERVRAVAAGDQQALHALYERTHHIVFTLIVRITSNRETAEEVTLDVFHDVWRRASSYDAAGGSVVGWIMNQARSRAIDRLRFERRKKRVDPQRGVAAPDATERAPDDVLHTGERARILHEAMTVLTSTEREAIETAYFRELSHSDVAAALNQPVGTIKTRIRSGLARLRKALAKDAT